MDWPAAVTSLREMFKGAISAYTWTLLEKWFDLVSAHLPPVDSFGAGPADRRKAIIAMLDAASEKLPWHARYRRKIINEMRIHLMICNGDDPLPGDLERIREFSSKAEFE